MWVCIAITTIVSLSKTLNYYCFSSTQLGKWVPAGAEMVLVIDCAWCATYLAAYLLLRNWDDVKNAKQVAQWQGLHDLMVNILEMWQIQMSLIVRINNDFSKLFFCSLAGLMSLHQFLFNRLQVCWTRPHVCNAHRFGGVDSPFLFSRLVVIILRPVLLGVSVEIYQSTSQVQI